MLVFIAPCCGFGAHPVGSVEAFFRSRLSAIESHFLNELKGMFA